MTITSKGSIWHSKMISNTKMEINNEILVWVGEREGLCASWKGSVSAATTAVLHVLLELAGILH